VSFIYVPSNYISDCSEMIVIVQNWISVYRKKCGKEHWENELKHLESMITPSQICSLDKSEIVATAKQLLVSSANNRVSSFKDFTTARDYLMMYICIDNASRTGAIANMTLKEFRNASVQDGANIVRVVNHKTIVTEGPVTLVFRKELYKETFVYISMRRNFEESEICNNDPLFISFHGMKMSSSKVTGQLNSFWQKAVGKSCRFSATKIRKASVTMIHTNKPEMKKDLSHLMAHTLNTAKKAYLLENKTKQATLTSTSLRELMRQDDKKAENDLEDIFCEDIKEEKIRLYNIREKRKLLPDHLKEMDDVQIRDKLRYIISQRKQTGM